MRYIWFLILLSFIASPLLIAGDTHAGSVPGTRTFVDINSKANIAGIAYSAGIDKSGICWYKGTGQNPTAKWELQINEIFIFSKKNLLFGTADPADCPLPGSKILSDYPNALAGEFLISGVICVVNSIIFDSMFRIYCTIMLWIYQIIYALCVIYIMFYGLGIMLGIGQDPLREAPIKILKIMIIFILATNAQLGFKIIHQMFINTLDTFTSMLVDVMPPWTEDGQVAYSYKSLTNTIIDKFIMDPVLLDLNGDPWQPMESGTDYYDPEDGSTNQIPPTIPSGLTPIPKAKADEYVPYRVPAMQWTYKKDSSGVLKLYRVFQEVQSASAIPSGKVAALFDVVWNPDTKRLEKFPRKAKNNWPTLPNIAPYGRYCTYDIVTMKTGNCGMPTPLIFPPRLVDPDWENIVNSTNNVCNEAFWWTCRQPFQGVLGKIDAMFNSVLGDDSARSIGGMAIAMVGWGIGGGTMLGILIMLGVTSMFVAFTQLLWTYITAIMAITFLLMLSPIFLSFALFKVTFKMFQGWLSNLISFTLQPFFITVFIYILSHITTVDRLGQLAREEVRWRVHQVNLAGNKSTARYVAPGFIAPLYKKPEDYDVVMAQTKDANLAAPNAVYINGEQRQEYLKELQDGYLTNWIALKSGTNMSKLVLKDEYAKFLNSTTANYTKPDFIKDLDLWYGGVFPAAVTVNNQSVTSTDKRRMAAILRYKKLASSNRYDKLIQNYYDERGDVDDDDAFVGENGIGGIIWNEFPTIQKTTPCCPGCC